MNSALTPHPDHEALLRLLDDDLSREERQLVCDHLGDCGTCRRDLDEVREALGEYLQFHQAILKAAYPPPPKSWGRLDLLAAQIPGRSQPPRAARFALTPRLWLAAAAAVASVFLAARLFERPPAVKAAELLRRAASAEKAAPAPARAIRIKSRNYKWDRPSRLAKSTEGTSADASGIRQLLESAGYSWEDPLSADAYRGWHDRLAEKQDRVESLPQAHVIHTTTTSSPISDASLTLRPDLHAVACTLRFGEAETVEMTEIADVAPAPRGSAPDGTPRAIQPQPSTFPARPAGPGEELQVMAALHRIGGDLGEPIDVRREGPNVLVNVTGLDARRQSEVKTALSGLPVVRIQFAEFEHRENPEAARGPSLQVDTANPLLSELLSALPDGLSTAELADKLMDNIERIIERVYALRGLARRFPAEETAQMTAAEVAMLNGLVRNHAATIASCRGAIEGLLQPILPRVSPPAAITESRWQDIAQGMLDDARGLDEALNAAGPPGDSGGRKLRVARTLAEMEQRLIRLRALVRQ